MCGIAGYINFDKKINKERFDKMVDIIEHRGPDDRGTYYHEGLALGHRRLSIIDLSSDGHQPFFYKERYVIIFNGEIYNYQSLREDLINKGHIFKNDSDTEVLLHAYEEYGEDMLNQLRGMFAFVIWDSKKELLFGARDFFGIKPFYYTIINGNIVYGSEIKSILEYPHFKKEVNLYKLFQKAPRRFC